MGIPPSSIPLDLGQANVVLVPSRLLRAAPTRPSHASSLLAVPSRCPGTHPSAKTSECLEKGSLSSSVSGESCRMISGARWHSQPFWIRSLFSLLPGHGAGAVGTTGGQHRPIPSEQPTASHPFPGDLSLVFPTSSLQSQVLTLL